MFKRRLGTVDLHSSQYCAVLDHTSIPSLCVSGAQSRMKQCSNVGSDPLIYIRYKIVWFVAICRFRLFVCVCVCVCVRVRCTLRFEIVQT